MRIRSVVTRLLLLSIWTGAVAATTAWTVGGAGPVPLQGYVTTPMVKTGRPLDLAIDGDEYFVVQDMFTHDGLLYTRHGRLTRNQNGELMMVVNDVTRPLSPPILIPEDATDIRVILDGTVTYVQSESTTAIQAGGITITKFDADQLRHYESGFFVPTDTTRPPVRGIPGYSGLGMKSVLDQITANESQPNIDR